jgi:DNA-binding transcriptional ArsR family regulator
MDTGISAAALARELGTSLPRVVRAIERLGIDARQHNGRMALGPADVVRLREELGAAIPQVAGLTPTEVKVLAALARAPLGLTSARTVAERAGVSPTTASRAIGSLREQGLVTVEQRTLPAGRARTVELIRVDYGSPSWQRLAGAIARVRGQARRRKASDPRVPPRLRHLFWNTASSQLNTERAGGYIARRLLTVGDPEGLAWGAANLSSEDWRHAARTRGVSPQRRALAHNYAAARSRGDAHSPSVPNDIPEDAKLRCLGAHDQSSLADVFAMKVKVIGDRGELRDYFDLKRIEEITDRRVEEGIGLYMTRYQVPPEHPSIEHIVESLGYLDDVDEDDMLPEDRATIAAYWKRRQPEISRNLARFPGA